jgi:hypothetical protein
MESRKQKTVDRNNLYFILYVIVIAVMAVVYVTVPDRTSFFEYQKKWWGEAWEAVTDTREGSEVKAIRK